MQAGYGAPKWPIWVPTRSEHAEGNSGHATMARRTRTWRGRRPLACTETSCAGLGRPCVWPCPSQQGPHGAPQGHARDARTQGVGQFHSTREATEQREPGARKHKQAQATTAEVVEGRELAKGNAGQHHRVRTQCRAALSRAWDRVRQAARESAIQLTALWHHVSSISRLREAYNRLNHQAAPGGMARHGPPTESSSKPICGRCQTA